MGWGSGGDCWGNAKQGGSTAFRRWAAHVEGASDEAGRALSAVSLAAGRLRCRSPGANDRLARRRGADSRAFWQRSVFRSSFPGCVGRQMSFGVVETVLREASDPFPGEYEASKGVFLTYSVVLTTEFRAAQGWAAVSFGNHYSEARFAANGDPGTTPKLDLLPAGTLGDDGQVP